MTNDEEENAVRQLSDLIGYGRMMQLAEQMWRKKLRADGLQGGEHMTQYATTLEEILALRSENAALREALTLAVERCIEKCCRCDKDASISIQLVDGDTAESAGEKHFCRDHAPGK